jgi:hypothetical protein
VSVFAITQAERAGWQRRAARELAAMLDVHRDLPIIGWTIGTAGATLVGHVSGLASSGQVRRVFDTWRTALRLTEYRECTFAGGITYLSAGASCDRARVRLTATVMADEDGQVRS